LINIPLLAIPNQSFSIQLDNDLYTLVIKAASNIMAADVIKNTTQLIAGSRIISNQLLIPYPYLYTGNFVLAAQNEQYPDYEQFGVTQYLLYFSQDELEALQN